MSDKQSEYGEQSLSSGHRYAGFNKRWKDKQEKERPQDEQLFEDEDLPATRETAASV